MRGRDVPVTVRKRAGCISLLARFPMKVEGVLDVSRRGYPATTAFSSLNPGICSIDSVIAVEGGGREFLLLTSKEEQNYGVLGRTERSCASQSRTTESKQEENN